MKETIKYYYNIDIDDLKEQDGKYFFKYQNQDFFFVYFNRNIEELNDILICVNNMKEKGIDVHNIIINRNGQYLTKINNFDYILMSVNNYNEEYDIFDMINIANKLTLNYNTSKLYRNNWSNLWTQKMDYFEYQIRELGINKTVIKDSFSYYLGLAENAISYVNNTNLKYNALNNAKITLAHRRIFYPNYKLNFLNPLAFIFDLEVRDIAEYLKAMFFSEDNTEEVIEELGYYLQIKKLTIYEYHMLYARLLYPSYYFDLYENIMNNDESEEKLVNIIKKNKEYELFLKNAYLEISKYAPIEKINWLIN
ncbi:MAG: hypothetical protein ACLUFU_05425 [Bacilli bacterium]